MITAAPSLSLSLSLGGGSDVKCLKNLSQTVEGTQLEGIELQTEFRFLYQRSACSGYLHRDPLYHSNLTETDFAHSSLIVVLDALAQLRGWTPRREILQHAPLIHNSLSITLPNPKRSCNQKTQSQSTAPLSDNKFLLQGYKLVQYCTDIRGRKPPHQVWDPIILKIHRIPFQPEQ